MFACPPCTLCCALRASCMVLEGYGQTECAAAATLSSINDVKTFGHVGGPLPCNEIKLVSVDDMGYRYDDKFHMRVLNDVRCRRCVLPGSAGVVCACPLRFS